MKKLINEEIKNMKFLIGYKPGRLISEQDNYESLIDRIIELDSELDNDPTYKKYERIYLKKALKQQMGNSPMFPMDDIPDEMLDLLMSMGGELKPKGGMTPEMIMSGKDKTIEHSKQIMQMAAEDNEFDLAIKLRNFIDLLKQL